MRLRRFRDAERDCDEAHALENAERDPLLQPERWSAKMLFRRGQARVGCREFEGAVADLERALMLAPADSAVKRELARARQALAAHKARRQQAYAAALAGAADEEAEASG